MVWVTGRVKLTHKNMSWVIGQPIFISGKKFRFGLGIVQIGLENSDMFFYIYLEAGSGCFCHPIKLKKK